MQQELIGLCLNSHHKGMALQSLLPNPPVAGKGGFSIIAMGINDMKEFLTWFGLRCFVEWVSFLRRRHRYRILLSQYLPNRSLQFMGNICADTITLPIFQLHFYCV